MTRSGTVSPRKLKKGSSSQKGIIFYQDGLAIDPIDVEPLRSASMAHVPYSTSEEEVSTVDTTR